MFLRERCDYNLLFCPCLIFWSMTTWERGKVEKAFSAWLKFLAGAGTMSLWQGHGRDASVTWSGGCGLRSGLQLSFACGKCSYRLKVLARAS